MNQADRSRRPTCRSLIVVGSSLGLLAVQSAALAQSYEQPDPTPQAPVTPQPTAAPTPPVPSETPEYFRKVYRNMLNSPLPKQIHDQGGVPAIVPQLEVDADTTGKVASYQPAGDTITASNAFFQSLGTNGRSCVTCHQPPSGMSVSAKNVQRRFANTAGHDPIFAAVDGANCPNQVPAAKTSGAPYGGRKGDLVNVYDNRFHIGLSAAEKADLVNFLEAL